LQSNIDLGIDVKPVSIVADPALIDDLLSNLIDNALKYTPPGGSVTVSVGMTHGKPVLAVEDSGPGIPEETGSGFGSASTGCRIPGARQRIGPCHRR